MIRLLVNSRQHPQRVNRLLRRIPDTIPAPVCVLDRSTRIPNVSCWYSSSSSKQENGREERVVFEEPIGLLEALRARYVSPVKTIYERLRPKEEADTSAEDGRPADRGSSQINKEPVPLTISEAWKIGLQGTHPSRVSRLRARAATPIITPSLQAKSDPAENALTKDDLPLAVELQRTHEQVEDNGKDPGAAESTKKKSLLESYLALDKRSQKIISISVFVWSLSGVIYFTWFSPTLVTSPTHSSTGISTSNLLTSSSSIRK
ncbi:hypothetical protein PSHT_00519 [Puccinia striiformis]|uniref:Uncharacterized protein n=1 Tax=Puccinia striiformis TaxID=27350 RepID=A0A2S4WN39_9BASI|nr:hypothetical protein PSHT_00519 [Puccinia striiformis]